MQNSSHNKILIIVPAFREEENITGVIESLHSENPEWRILVVNDGSEDNTGKLAEATGKADVINLPANLGIGGAVQTGFKFASRNGFDIAVQFDGDGQHIASELHKMLDALNDGGNDVVIGSRFCGKNKGWKSTKMRRLAILAFQWINSLLIRQKITDNTSGFRAYNSRAIEFLSENYPMDYPEPEAVILLGKSGFRIKEVPVQMQQREGGQTSIPGLKQYYYMAKVLLGIFITYIRRNRRQKGDA